MTGPACQPPAATTTATFAWLTPPGAAAIALVRLDGVPPALFDRRGPGEGQARLVTVLSPTGEPVDQAVAWGQGGRIDLGVHGGDGMRAAITACLVAHGLHQRPAPAVEPRWAALARAASPAAVTWLLRHDHLEEPPFPARYLAAPAVVLISGPANAGKSSLLNAWCGRPRALVSPEAGTTRDLVTAEVLVGGWGVRLIDSAGLRASSDLLEQAGQSLARAARLQADLVLYLRPPGDTTEAGADALEILGKADLRRPDAYARGQPWSAVGIPGQDPLALLAGIEQAVLRRLGLPEV